MVLLLCNMGIVCGGTSQVWLFPELFPRRNLSVLSAHGLTLQSVYLHVDIYPYLEELQVPCCNYRRPD